jgi:hypothetical protein
MLSHDAQTGMREQGGRYNSRASSARLCRAYCFCQAGRDVCGALLKGGKVTVRPRPGKYSAGLGFRTQRREDRVAEAEGPSSTSPEAPDQNRWALHFRRRSDRCGRALLPLRDVLIGTYRQASIHSPVDRTLNKGSIANRETLRYSILVGRGESQLSFVPAF